MFEGFASKFVDTGDASTFAATDAAGRHPDHRASRPITGKFAIQYWHWFFFAQPGIPERVINAGLDAWYHGNPAAVGAENYDEWRDATRNPR